MKYNNISRILGLYLFGFAMTLLVALGVAFYYEYFTDPALHPQKHATLAFLWTTVLTLVLASIFRYFGRVSRGNIYRREALLAVVLIWFLSPALAALPFLFNGTFASPFQAYLETTSGLTTTGVTAMQAKEYDLATGKEVPIRRVVCGVNTKLYSYMGSIAPVRDPETGKILFEGIEAVGKGLLFWRGFMQWLGGLGIVALFVALLPMLGVGGRVLIQTEMTGPTKDTLTPRIKETVIGLWKVYFGLTVLQISLLMLTNPMMQFYDAMLVTFSTLSTGGFSNYNTSIGFFDNAATEWVVIVFMIVGSINFALYYLALRGKLYKLYDQELFLYLILLVLSCSFAAYFIVGTSKILLTGVHEGVYSLSEAIRQASFQVVSCMTTTGFASVDFDKWPYIVQVLMLIVMYFGGMSGSTSAGIKTIRILMIFRIIQFKVESIFRPETVRKFEVNGKDMDTNTSIMVLCFVLTLMAFSALGVFLFTLDGVDPETALSLVASCINNAGIGFRMAGPTQSLAFLSDYGLMVASLLMLFGRLEFFVILAVLVPSFWRNT